MILQSYLLNELATGDDFVMIGCFYYKFQRGFIRRMVNDRQPAVRTVGPVVSKKGAVSVTVLVNNQSVGRNPGVFDRQLKCFSYIYFLAGIDKQLLFSLNELRFCRICENFFHFHALAGGGIKSIQIELNFVGLFEKMEEDICVSCDPVVVVVDRNFKTIMLHVKAFKSLLVILGLCLKKKKAKQSENRMDEMRMLPDRF